MGKIDGGSLSTNNYQSTIEVIHFVTCRMSNPEPVAFATNRGHAMQWFIIGQYYNDNNNMNTKLLCGRAKSSQKELIYHQTMAIFVDIFCCIEVPWKRGLPAAWIYCEERQSTISERM